MDAMPVMTTARDDECRVCDDPPLTVMRRASEAALGHFDILAPRKGGLK